ncbi:hypothetical protein IMCC9480_1714 [Oxalobacteraceae bacterium IMCC9480]|nr:hypothetical protein IMCC9480_1714 [Oxalobacteraceae bacterium IMCC9480]
MNTPVYSLDHLGQDQSTGTLVIEYHDGRRDGRRMWRCCRRVGFRHGGLRQISWAQSMP